MPRKLFKRWSPDPHKIRNAPGMRFFGKLLDDPNLFHLNRHSVSVAFAVGLFICFLPVPGQILLATLAALVFRCNLPIAVALVWISNPLTFAFIFYGAFELGSWVLDRPRAPFTFELSWQWFTTGFPAIWQPLVLGCLIMGIFTAFFSYWLIQWFWRWHVLDRWNSRRSRRKQADAEKSSGHTK